MYEDKNKLSNSTIMKLKANRCADLSASALAESEPQRETLMFFRHYRRPEMYRRLGKTRLD